MTKEYGARDRKPDAMFTRRHYNVLATIFASSKDYVTFKQNLIKYLEQDNHNFDKAYFIVSIEELRGEE